MTECPRSNKRPGKLMRILLRAPVWLYRARLGWLLGHRFVLLTHAGRKSGLPRQTVLEVVRWDESSGACVVASGWGERSDWVQNISIDPKIHFQVSSTRSPGLAERLPPADAAQELLDYSRRNPRTLRALAVYMGYQLDGTDEAVSAMGWSTPMFVFKPGR